MKKFTDWWMGRSPEFHMVVVIIGLLVATAIAGTVGMEEKLK